MIFNILLIFGIILLSLSWRKQYIYQEGTEKYKNWYLVFELGWWMFFIGLLKYLL